MQLSLPPCSLTYGLAQTLSVVPYQNQTPDQQSLHFPGHTPVYPYLSGAKEDWLGFVAGFRFIGWLSQQLVPDFIPKRVPFY